MRHRPRNLLALTVVLATAIAMVPGPIAGAKGKPPKPSPSPSPAPSGCATSASTVSFAGRTWTVKRTASLVGPGPNYFSGANVCVDAAGLRLRISRDLQGRWQSSEVYLPASLGYGTYEWTVVSRVDNLNSQAVLGLFTYESDTKEIDIEFARWGVPSDPTNGQFVVQPWDTSGNLYRFTQPALTTSIHRFVWSPGSVTFTSRSSDSSWSRTWTRTTSDVPVPGGERVHMNLWLYQGAALASGATSAEVVISDFRFTPAP
ncbi:MAG: hypothetical protein ACKOKE_07045 [Actinomycetota bacterium]